MTAPHDTDPAPPLTWRDHLDDANDAHPVIRWGAVVVGILFIAGALVRACCW